MRSFRLGEDLPCPWRSPAAGGWRRRPAGSSCPERCGRRGRGRSGPPAGRGRRGDRGRVVDGVGIGDHAVGRDRISFPPDPLRRGPREKCLISASMWGHTTPCRRPTTPHGLCRILMYDNHLKNVLPYWHSVSSRCISRIKIRRGGSPVRVRIPSRPLIADAPGGTLEREAAPGLCL